VAIVGGPKGFKFEKISIISEKSIFNANLRNLSKASGRVASVNLLLPVKKII
jgi:hypothetical protein